METSDNEGEEQEDDKKEDKQSKKDRIKAEKYQLVIKQINEIFDSLEKWGYSSDKPSIDGHTPLTLATKCYNVPMMLALINKNSQIVRCFILQ